MFFDRIEVIDKNGYIIKDDVINATNNDYDYEVFNVRLWLAQKSTAQFSGQIKINVTSEVAMNLATDLIMAMNVNQNIDGLSYDLDDLPRYNGLNVHNYVLFNDELWRILGISQESTEGYVKYLTNQRTKLLGLGVVYKGFTKNPYEYLNTEKRENFFETKVTEYSRSEAVDGWDDF